MYKNGRLNGFYRSYSDGVRIDKDGTFLTIPDLDGTYLNGLKEGIWKNYRSDGSLYSKRIWKQGIDRGKVK